MKTTPEILATFNCPEKAVKHNGVWMWPEELSPPKLGEFYWNHLGEYIDTAECKFRNPSIIFRPIPLPPKPTPEQLAKITPAGKVAALKDEPDCESVPFVNDDCRFICTHEDLRAALYHGLRWPVILTDAPKEQVKRKSETSSCENCKRDGETCTYQEIPKAKVCDIWIQKAEPVAVKVEPWCNVPDYPGSSNQIQRAIEQLQRRVEALEKK